MPSTIFNIPSSDSHAPSIHVSHAEIPPTYLDPTQPPLKRLPFRLIRGVPFVRDVTVCMPTRVYNTLFSNSDDGPSGTADDTPAKSTLKPALGGREVKYAKVIMTLADVLSDYDLRTGNYVMLAGPLSPGSNDVTLSLNSGILSLTMPHAIYQRSGLTFPTTKVASGGRKHDKGSMRYKLEIDLRALSMVKGRKGFDRLMYAAKNVDGLREGRAWLFGDLANHTLAKGKKRKRIENDDEKGGGSAKDGEVAVSTTSMHTAENREKKQGHPHQLSAHHPTLVVDPGRITTQTEALVPPVVSDPSFLSTLHIQSAASRAKESKGGLPTVLADDIHELVEYVSLLSLASPRITKKDYQAVDPYVCRYTLPSGTSSKHIEGEEAPIGPSEIVSRTAAEGDGAQGVHRVEDVTSVQYSGFIPSDFVLQLVIDVIRRSRATSSDKEEGESEEANAWIALTVRAHQTEAKGGIDGLMVLLQSRDGSFRASAGHANTAADVMDVDGTTERHRTDGSTGKQGRNEGAQGFRYVTCFEFVDSMT